MNWEDIIKEERRRFKGGRMKEPLTKFGALAGMAEDLIEIAVRDLMNTDSADRISEQQDMDLEEVGLRALVLGLERLRDKNPLYRRLSFKFE
jgi:hypothetical protein|tara:strand:- start:2835 stop:3110 length:276 start_codon:yes stop_codon:yes gene_type:complete